MFYNMLIRSLDRNPQNSGEVFQNAKIRVWGRFQNVWKNIHPCMKTNHIFSFWVGGRGDEACLIGKRGCILNLIKIMIDDRKIVIFPVGKGEGRGGEASKWTRICTSLYTLHV